MATIIAGYVPVIHRGYLDILENHPHASIAVFDTDIIAMNDYLRKELRALSPHTASSLLKQAGRDSIVIKYASFKQLVKAQDTTIILIDDDLTRKLVSTLDNKSIRATITFISPFLRWDRENSEQNADADFEQTIVETELPSRLIAALYTEAYRSTDWWRHVAAAVYVGNDLFVTHNAAMPHEYITAIESDPRITERRGEKIDKSLFIHAEAALVAHAAKHGIALEGKDIYVTTFPCANCARLIAASDVKRCYFIEGYANLDGERILRGAGVSIVKIKLERRPPKISTDRLKVYPEKPVG